MSAKEEGNSTLNIELETGENVSWNLFTLREEFQSQNLEDLFGLYVQKIHHGYYSLFLILQIVLSTSHIAVLLIENMKYIDLIFPDIICYTIIAVLAIFALFLKETVGKSSYNNSLTIAIPTFLLLVILDLFTPLYHTPYALLRPAYTTHVIIACYVFLPISDNLQAAVCGAAITVCHLIILGCITYKKVDKEYWYRLGSDALYMICINGAGIYFRYMNEILKRKTFLDRRACVQSTVYVKYEKDQEEQLMLSILPQHITIQVREDIKQTLKNLESSAYLPEKPLRDCYIQPHDNVTILYADIVRYTEMTRKLPVIKLVETLNELFGKFDDASEDHNVLRIKFLGDCYYCVSGIPVSNQNHAINCVELGLEMITIIQQIRRKRSLNIDMRIGVHSGSIFGGVIGECKWQYDIWSKDVDIANRMEQSGQPGKVHITNHTLKLLQEKYQVVRSDASEKDEYLKKLNIKTFLISPNYDLPTKSAVQNSNGSLYDRRASSSTNKNYSNPPTRQNSLNVAGIMSHRRTAFMSHNVKKYQLLLTEIENKLEEAIRDLPLRKFEQWFRSPIINPFLLTFKNWKLEFPYFLLPDPLFKYYLLSSSCILLAILGIQYLTLFQFDLNVWILFITLSIFIVILIPLAWMHIILKRINSAKKYFITAIHFYSKLSKKISNSTYFRIFVYIFSSCLIATSTILDLVDCHACVTQENFLNNDNTCVFYCTTPWHITQTCSLAIIASFLFLRIHLVIKFFVAGIITGLFSYLVYNLDYVDIETWNRELKPQIACVLSVTFLTITLHLIDRQAEYLNRLDYHWKTKLTIEQNETQMMHKINILLLQNILPIHVAQHYLDTSRSVDELYHEQYKSVSVMFASVVDIYLDENDIDVSASTIKIMNTIISEFDKLLLKPCGHKIEKIKVVGWTYMAACGLDPGRKDSTTSVYRESGKNIVIQLIRFGVNMMKVLQKITGSFSAMKLRIGISHGEVTAGVVGAKKPLYDIWGDAVNMASRMESTGEKDMIQVTENTAQILKKQGIKCTYRGQTKIKSLDYTIPTYFVNLDYPNLALFEENILR